MDKLIIVSQSNLESSKQEISDFALMLKEELNLDVHYGKYNQNGFAVTWWEVFNVWLPAGSIYSRENS